MAERPSSGAKVTRMIRPNRTEVLLLAILARMGQDCILRVYWKLPQSNDEQVCWLCRLWLQMDKDWQARFEASEPRPRSMITHLYVLDMLGYVGLAIGLVIVAISYFKNSRPSL